MSKHDTPAERVQKAYKSVEKAATAARNTVIAAQRNARAESKREEQEKLSREVKRLKRDKGMYNSQIAEKLGLSESSVRALLLMKIKGEN